MQVASEKRVFGRSGGSFAVTSRLEAAWRWASAGCLELASWMATRPKRMRRRTDAYALPGFRPQPTVRGVMSLRWFGVRANWHVRASTIEFHPSAYRKHEG